MGERGHLMPAGEGALPLGEKGPPTPREGRPFPTPKGHTHTQDPACTPGRKEGSPPPTPRPQGPTWAARKGLRKWTSRGVVRTAHAGGQGGPRLAVVLTEGRPRQGLSDAER